MTLLSLYDYNTRTTEKFAPQWMREERYNYCEPMNFRSHTVSDFLNNIKVHIRKWFN